MADNIDYNKLADAIAKAMNASANRRSSNRGQEGVPKEVIKTFEDAAKAIEKLVERQNKAARTYDEIIDAQKDYADMMKRHSRDSDKIQKINETRLKDFGKLIDGFDGPASLVNDNIKELAKMMSSSTNAFGTLLKDFNGRRKRITRNCRKAC